MTYREFVKMSYPKVTHLPFKSRLAEIAKMWAEHKKTHGGIITASGLTGAGVTAAGLVKKKDKRTKAIGGYLKSLKLELPEGVKDGNKVSNVKASKLRKHVEGVLGKKIAKDSVMLLKKILA